MHQIFTPCTWNDAGYFRVSSVLGRSILPKDGDFDAFVPLCEGAAYLVLVTCFRHATGNNYKRRPISALATEPGYVPLGIVGRSAVSIVCVNIILRHDRLQKLSRPLLMVQRVIKKSMSDIYKYCPYNVTGNIFVSFC